MVSTQAYYGGQGELYGLADAARTIPTVHARRALAGNFGECIVASAIRGRRLKTDTRCTTCPDVSRAGLYFECKTVREGGAVVVYASRLEKERAYPEPLLYAVLTHRARFAGASTCAALYAILAGSTCRLYLLDLATIDRLTQGVRLRQNVPAKPGAGWYTRGYERGYYGIALPVVREACSCEAGRRRFDARGNRGGVMLYTTPEAGEMLREKRVLTQRAKLETT